VWSLGATLLAPSTGYQVAFAADDRRALKRGTRTLDGAIAGLPEAGKLVWEGLGEPLREVIGACLRLDPAARPPAAAHRLALSETETRLASGGPCTAEELGYWLRARAGCGDPSMRARVRGDDGTLLQALQQPEVVAAAGTDLCDATSALLTLLGAQLSTAALPVGADSATALGRTSGEKLNHTAMLAALTGALDATSTGPMTATTLASLRAAGDRTLRSRLTAVRCITRVDSSAAADSGTSPSGLAAAGASAPAPTAPVAALVALPSTSVATSGLAAAAPLPSRAEVQAASAALREAPGNARAPQWCQRCAALLLRRHP